MSFPHAPKHVSLYTKQLAALDKHRGKVPQKVTVDHMIVAAGGQAIVDNVKTGRTPCEFLEAVLEAVPYKIYTILTNNHCPLGDCEAICREGASSSVSNHATGTRPIPGPCGLT